MDRSVGLPRNATKESDTPPARKDKASIASRSQIRHQCKYCRNPGAAQNPGSSKIEAFYPPIAGPSCPANAEQPALRGRRLNGFPKSPSLPAEVRVMIWKQALPGPRIVELRLRPLPRVQSHNHGCQNEHLLAYYMCGCSSTNPGGPNTEELWVDLSCKNPSVLYVNREAYEVAPRYYQPVFASPISMPGTYFDFELDTLYIQYPKFATSDIGFIYRDAPGVINSFRRLDSADLHMVRNLAVFFSGDGYQFSPAALYHRKEQELGELLTVFKGVRKFTFVVDHYRVGNSMNLGDSSVSFIEPINVDHVFTEYWSHHAAEGYETNPVLSQPPRTANVEQIAKLRMRVLEDHLLKLQKPHSLPDFDIKTCVTEAMKQTPAHFPVDPSQFPRGMPVTPWDLFHLREALMPNAIRLEHVLMGERVVLGGLHLRSKARTKASYSRLIEWGDYLESASNKYAEDEAEKLRYRPLQCFCTRFWHIRNPTTCMNGLKI